MKFPILAIVMPVYNEEEIVETVIYDWLKATRKLDL